jgi:shikimate dehydrogenase
MHNIFADFKNEKVIGNIGHPIFPSYLSTIHNSSFKILGLNYVFVPFDVHPQNMDIALRGILSLGIAGINLTFPHSTKVLRMIDEITGEASMVGSVNTIINEGDRLIGYNTHINGIAETLKPYRESILDQQVTIFGAGNIAKIVVYTIVKYFKPKLIQIVNRAQQKAEHLRKYVREELNFNEIRVLPLNYEELVPKNTKSKVIVNATPLGMFPKTEECYIDSDKLFNENQIVIDLVYNPAETTFLKMAKNKGAKTITGLDILLLQAAKSFEHWTNKTMPVDEIRKILAEMQK